MSNWPSRLWQWALARVRQLHGRGNCRASPSAPSPESGTGPEACTNVAAAVPGSLWLLRSEPVRRLSDTRSHCRVRLRLRYCTPEQRLNALLRRTPGVAANSQVRLPSAMRGATAAGGVRPAPATPSA